MIPILFDTNETSFTSNGLGRLRDCIECKVTEERNGVYEADFQYPVTGANFDRIKVGRIIGVTHNESEDIQPFDIVSYEKPINGVVTFHCTHISYRQSYMTVTGSNINSLADAFTLLGNAEPTNPFTYQTDKTSSAYMSGADGKPKSVRSLLGGTEGSILDTYGGEYEWDKFKVILHSSRGETRPFSIRYGVNMLEYNEDFDTQGSYSSCIPFWSNGTETVVGDRQFATGVTIANRGECVPLDVSDKFEAQPTKAEVEAMGLSVMASKNVYNPTQTLHVEFARLQDVPDYENFKRLYQCNLCDTINVVFPDYKSTGQFKIVKTVWDVLKDRYESMELGDLSISLSQALGINNSSSYSGSGGGGGGGTDDYTELTNKPQINNVTLTGNKTSSQIGVADAVHTHTVSQITDFPTLATVATSGNYNDLSNKPSIPTITDTYDGTSSNGMSGKAVKSAIDALDGTISGSPGAGKTLTAFSQTDGKVSATFGNISITKSQVSDFPTLATVATSGDYDDLIDKPTLSAVATSGDYDDLINKPTIPTVNDATLTIQKNGTTVNTFTANASSNVTANITVPTNNNELTNGAGYITSPNIPYCTCATAAGTAAKTTTIVSGTFTSDDLVTGAQVLVKFTNSNTVANPTLKIGSTTAKSIKRYGTTAPSTSAASSWNANSVIMFTYDGTYWQMTDYNNTTYSSMTTAEYEAGTGTTARTITPARLKDAIQHWDAVKSVNGKTGAVTLTASDVGALPDTTTYVSSFNGSTGAVTYTAPVTSVNSKTGAVTLTASDVGALPDSTTIPSKLSDLTNDLIYDLGTVTPNDGVFSVSNDDVTAITALWNDGFCALKLSVNSKDYYAYKERIITYNGLNFMGFVAVEADIAALAVLTGKTLVGINANGIGMFAVIPDMTAEDVQVEVSSGLAGKQDTLVSGTNIKTINSQSILGSGDLNISVSGTKNIWYGTCSTAAATQEKAITTTSGDFVLGTGNMLRVSFTNAAGVVGAITLNVDGTGAKNAYYHYNGGYTQVNREGWSNGEVIDFVYDGTRFLMVDGGLATTSHRGKTLLEDSTSSTSTTTAATPNSVKTAYDLADTANTLAGVVAGNLVTSVSSASTDTEYPSAKCVYERTTPTVIQAHGSGNVSTTSGAITQIPLVTTDAVYNNTRDAEIDTTLGGIKIKTAGIYRVYGSIYFTNASGVSRAGVYLYQSTNGGNYASATEIHNSLMPSSASTSNVIPIASKLISCAVNDGIYLAGRALGGSSTLSGNNQATYLCVEKVGE